MKKRPNKCHRFILQKIQQDLENATRLFQRRHGTKNCVFNQICFLSRVYAGFLSRRFKAAFDPTQWVSRTSSLPHRYISSVYGRVSRSSPAFQTKRHAQELAVYSRFPFRSFLQTYYIIICYYGERIVYMFTLFSFERAAVVDPNSNNFTMLYVKFTAVFPL